MVGTQAWPSAVVVCAASIVVKIPAITQGGLLALALILNAAALALLSWVPVRRHRASERARASMTLTVFA